MHIQPNTIDALITDLTVIESSFSSTGRVDGADYTASMDLTFNDPITNESDGFLSVAVVTNVSLSASLSDDVDDTPFFTGSVAIGCTVVCPLRTGESGKESLESKLLTFALETCVGHARQIILAESSGSSSRIELIIPPVEVI